MCPTTATSLGNPTKASFGPVTLAKSSLSNVGDSSRVVGVGEVHNVEVDRTVSSEATSHSIIVWGSSESKKHTVESTSENTSSEELREGFGPGHALRSTTSSGVGPDDLIGKLSSNE